MNFKPKFHELQDSRFLVFQFKFFKNQKLMIFALSWNNLLRSVLPFLDNFPPFPFISAITYSCHQTKAVIFSVKKAFLNTSKNSQKNTVPDYLFE